MASWIAVASALRGDVRPWMDATTRAAVRNGLWPPLLAKDSWRTNIGPGLIVLYAVITACIAALTTLLITVGILSGSSLAATLLWIVFSIPCSVLALFVAQSVFSRIEARHAFDCYPEAFPGEWSELCSGITA